MLYKLLLIKNRTTEKDNLQPYLDWFSKNTPIDVQIVDRMNTDFDVTTKFIGNATFKGVVCGDDIVAKLRTVVPEGKYNAVVLYVGNPLNGIRVSTVNGGGNAPLYADTELIQLRTIDDGGKDLNHELFHAFFFKANKRGANILDELDSYLNDSDMNVDNVVTTNREIALQKLAPFWDKIVSLNAPQTSYNVLGATLTRLSDNSVETLGIMRVGDFWGSDTLELPWRDNKQNISCIPKGKYLCKWKFMLRDLKYHYQLQNVKGRSGIFIHAGNFFFNSKGCIIVGSLPKDVNGDGQVDLQNSKLILASFEKLMNKKDFVLEIK